MTIEQQVQDHEQRIQALENAPKPIPHNTPETNPWMRAGLPSEPKQPISRDFQEVFGFWADELGRRLIAPGSVDEATWLTKQSIFGGLSAGLPADVAKNVSLLVEHYGKNGIDATPKLVKLGNAEYLAFPEIRNLGYGTPDCFLVGVGNFTRDAADGQVDWTIAEIEKRRAK